MTRGKLFIWVALLIIPVLLAGCTDNSKIENQVDNAKIDSIEVSQKEILAKITAIEGKISSIESNQKEMMKVFKKPGGKPAIDYNKVHKFPTDNSAIRGNPKAPVTIVEFSDFQCPYCSKLQPTLEEVLKLYPNDVRLVFKDFPLSFHKQAMNAARAARAAGEQGKYWEMHDLIFVDYNKLTESHFENYATKLGLDKTKFMADFKSGKYDKFIQQDMNLGRSAGVGGTPTMFMNGKRMQRRSVADFKTSIEGYLKKK